MENCRELRTAVGTTRAAGDGAPLQTTYHITRTHPLSVASSLLPFFLDPIKALSHPLEKHWGNSTSQVSVRTSSLAPRPRQIHTSVITRRSLCCSSLTVVSNYQHEDRSYHPRSGRHHR